MPQLDRIIIFPQIFWLFIVFTFLYIILTHFFLPKLLKNLKARKQIIEANNHEISIMDISLNEHQSLLKQLVLKDLVLIENTLKKTLLTLNFDILKVNNQLIDEKVARVSINNFLYCDIQLLNRILLYPKSLNLKFKPN